MKFNPMKNAEIYLSILDLLRNQDLSENARKNLELHYKYAQEDKTYTAEELIKDMGVSPKEYFESEKELLNNIKILVDKIVDVISEK